MAPPDFYACLIGDMTALLRVASSRMRSGDGETAHALYKIAQRQLDPLNLRPVFDAEKIEYTIVAQAALVPAKEAA